MKKIIYLIILMVFSITMLVGCGNKEGTIKEKDNSGQSGTQIEKKKDGPNRDIEVEAFLDKESIHFENYDTEVFYTDKVSIFYEMLDGYESLQKMTYSTGEIREYYFNGEISIDMELTLASYHERTAKEECHVQQEAKKDSTDSWKNVSDKKDITVNDNDVCYYYAEIMLDEESEYQHLYVYIDINEEYILKIDVTREDGKVIEYDFIKDVVESIVVVTK